MKTWETYERYLLSGEWHIHTNYTDGKNNVLDFCKKAVELGIPLMAFTEHVRRQLRYDFNRFLNDIEIAREEFPDLIILSGAEAKVLPESTLNIDEALLNRVDYPIFAFHSFPPDLRTYVNCLKTVLGDTRINAWAHPGLFLRRTGLLLSQREIIEISGLMVEKKVLLEVNEKYGLPEKEWVETALRNGVKIVRGNDIHSLEDLEHFDKK